MKCNNGYYVSASQSTCLNCSTGCATC